MTKQEQLIDFSNEVISAVVELPQVIKRGIENAQGYPFMEGFNIGATAQEIEARGIEWQKKLQAILDIKEE